MKKWLIFHYRRIAKFLHELDNKNVETRDHGLSNYFFVLGSSIVCLGFFIILSTSVLFFLDIPISKLNFVLGSGISAFFTFVIAKQFFSRNKLYLTFFSTILIVAALIVGSLYIEGKFYDISYDGQAYHQEAIMHLSEGWNPYFRLLADEEASAGLERWVNHYAKGQWILATSIYKFTGEIETGKAFNLIFIFAAFCLTFSALLSIEKLKPFYGLLISLLTALNPVSIYQSLSFYLDGQLISLLICLFAIAYKIFHGKRGVKLIPFVAVIGLFINTKLTAPVYAGLLLTAYLVLLWLYEKIGLTVQMFKIITFSVCVAVFVIGFNPFVTNFLYKGHPLYPAAGRGSSDYIEGNMPGNFFDETPPERLFLSIFSKSANIRGENARAEIKAPFTFSDDELKAFRDTNTKVGGFGPLFGGAMIISIWILGYLWSYAIVKHKFKYRNKILVATFVILIIIISSLINPAASLARWVPQVWLISIFVLILALCSGSYLMKTLGIVLIFLLGLNNYLIAKEYITYNQSMTQTIHSKINEYSQKDETPIKIDFKEFGSTKLKLEENDINWERISIRDTECNTTHRFSIHNVSEICEMN